MQNLAISVIIPVYNDSANLKKCLRALYQSDFNNFETIVVDDGSTDSILETVKIFPCKVVKLAETQGVSAARNKGARDSRGEILLFIDSDIEIEKDTINKIASVYINHDVNIYQGITSKKPANKGFGPELLALKWYYEQAKVNSSSFLHSYFFSIKREIFDEFHGFNEQFKSPGGEEFEFGHRLIKYHIIHNDSTLQVRHNFENTFQRTRSIYRRSKIWFLLFIARRKLEKLGITLLEVLITIFSTLTLLALILSIIAPDFIYLLIIFFSIYSLLSFKFYFFIFKEKGALFLLISIPVIFLWYLSASLGVMTGALEYLFGKLTGKQ